MFVCHGNICRSPMAEFVFRDMLEKRGAADGFAVSSCATSSEEIWGGIGNPVYPPAKAELAKHGLSCGNKRAVQLRKNDYGKYDLFVAMDSANVRNIMRIFGSDPGGKVIKLLDSAGGGDVADPWYSGDFARAFDDIERGCRSLADKLLNGELLNGK
ncbi:MAG: low molecular weight phosphotyrosine protein phosphatase [Clostridia bacterium]|nr:low molecular weight phosphotyrosine protein phosphatase [Clostridia bacterium]